MLENGSLVDGKYRVLQEVGHGGMSVVYLALNERANKTWAIKEVRKNGSTSFEVVRQGLIAETNILKKLNHPHLPSIIDVIDQDDSFLVVMDYIEGITLSKLLKNSGPQPWRDVVEWGKQLCDVLAYLHSRKPPIIYRDMKPDNVQLKPDGTITLLDFGTAREYKYRGAEGSDTSCLGTRGYAAPEQYGGMGETDARTDIYCLGATLYHLLTGYNPSLPPYEMKPIRSINPALPRGLEQIILRCTQQDPALRYQNCTDLMYDLENIEKVNVEYRRRQRQKMNLFIGSAAMAGVMALAAVGFKIGYNSRSADQYDRYVSQGQQYAAAVQTEGDANYLASEAQYISAIKLQPQTEDAYLGLAALYGGKDASVTGSECASMQGLLADKVFERKGRKYAQFAFTWGSYLYFYFSTDTNGGVGEGSPVMAKIYLKSAMESNPSQLDDDPVRGQAKSELAAIMYNIAEGEEMLKSKDRINAEYTYSDYWDDLNRILEVSLETTESGGNRFLTTVDSGAGNSTYFALSLYKTVIDAIHDNMVEFNAAGKSVSSIQAMIDRVEQANQQLYAEYRTAIENDPANKVIYDYINRQIASARQLTDAM